MFTTRILSGLRLKINNKQFAMFSSKQTLYFDYQATTPIDYRVLDAMTPYMMQHYGNPHSKTHQFGWDSAKGV